MKAQKYDTVTRTLSRFTSHVSYPNQLKGKVFMSYSATRHQGELNILPLLTANHGSLLCQTARRAVRNVDLKGPPRSFRGEQQLRGRRIHLYVDEIR